MNLQKRMNSAIFVVLLALVCWLPAATHPIGLETKTNIQSSVDFDATAGITREINKMLNGASMQPIVINTANTDTSHGTPHRQLNISVTEPATHAYVTDKLLDSDQDYIYNTSIQKNLDYYLVMALISVESEYETDLISATDDYGLMQINKCNHNDGLDYLDIRTNIDEGTTILSNLVHKYDTLDKALMAYNMGEGGASELWKDGIVSSEYSTKVLTEYHRLLNEYAASTSHTDL